MIFWGMVNKEKALPRWTMEWRIIRYAYDPLEGCLTTKKPCPASRGSGLYYFYPLQKQAFDGLKIIKPCCFRNKALSL
jgi:hypothetical protein